MKHFKFAIPAWGWLLGILILAGGLKLGLLLFNRIPFNSDEAVVTLMARHILQGERPIFFYGQAYWGSLDAWLVAAGFRIFGESLWAARLVQGLLYAATILTTAQIGQTIFKDHRVGLLAAGLLAIPTINITLYTTVSLGYGEALLLGNLIVLVGLEIGKQLRSLHMPPGFLWILLGLLSGLGFWALSITLVYTVPVGIYLIVFLYRFHHSAQDPRLRWRTWLMPFAAVTCGAFVGSLPWWLYAFENGIGELIREFTGGASAGLGGSPLAQVGQHLLNFIVLGSTVTFGLRPPWSTTVLALPLAPFVLAFWLAVVMSLASVFRSKDDQKPEKYILLGIMFTLTMAFIFSPFGGNPSGRYFLPLAMPLALFAADFVRSLMVRFGKPAMGFIALILVYNLWSTLQGIQLFPAELITRFDVVTPVNQRTIHDLISFLEVRGETRGYTNYWVAYPLAFFSKEELIFIPRLPYHSDFSYTTRDDRYIAYDPLVAASAHVAYITTNFPDLDVYLRDRFDALGVHWEEAQIGDFQVFYDLSSPVEPSEIGLGFDNPP